VPRKLDAAHTSLNNFQRGTELMRSDHYYARLERLGTDKEVRADRKKLEQDIKEYLRGGGKIEELPGVGDGIIGRAETNDFD
jgi:hypothetical protein